MPGSEPALSALSVEEGRQRLISATSNHWEPFKHRSVGAVFWYDRIYLRKSGFTRWPRAALSVKLKPRVQGSELISRTRPAIVQVAMMAVFLVVFLTSAAFADVTPNERLAYIAACLAFSALIVIEVLIQRADIRFLKAFVAEALQIGRGQNL